ncbi:hypothetical protein [Okeania sp. SIO1I7]|uniref:hypothetical protein n=1 Tax=Okeania sp. SIO1I7 TaxID=2607772 RepID=UPI0013F89319|nr:hypothetical protein [Okeania sp. SIO1I7]NET26577.1 hypothetical protein [Okeania sp. SIO1I7]
MFEPSTVIVISLLLGVFRVVAWEVRSFSLIIISNVVVGFYIFWLMHQAWLNFLLTMKEISGN